MKTKLIAGVLLAAALAVFLWWRFQPASSPKTSSNSVKPSVAPAPPVSVQVPLSTAKMTVVAPAAESVSKPYAKPYVEQKPNWSAIQTIVNSAASYQERVSAFSALSSRLSDMDWEALQQFLLKPDPSDRNQQSQLIKNQVMDLLCAMDPPPAGLGDVLTKMFRDHQQDDVVRDYAVQHLAAYYEQMSGHVNSNDALKSTQQVLWEAVKERGGSIGGTALLALKKLSQEYSADFDQSQIAASALQMAQDNYSGELTHITAYQVCAQLGVRAALPVIEAAAQQSPTVSAQLSAIGALGLLGSPVDIPLLEKLLQSDDERLKPAVKHALERIAIRQNQTVNPQVVNRK